MGIFTSSEPTLPITMDDVRSTQKNSKASFPSRSKDISRSQQSSWFIEDANLASLLKILRRISSSDTLSLSDKNFWEQELLGLQDLIEYAQPNQVEKAMASCCREILINNVKSHNIPILMSYLCKKLNDLPSTLKNPPIDIINTLFLARILIKHIIEMRGDSTSSESSGDSGWLLNRHFVDPNREIKERKIFNDIKKSDNENILDAEGPVLITSVETEHNSTLNKSQLLLSLPLSYVNALINATMHVELNSSSYELHYEILTTLLVLASTQMFSDNNEISIVNPSLPLFLSEICQSIHIIPFIKCLLSRFIEDVDIDSKRDHHDSSFTSSLLYHLTHSLQTIILLPVNLYKYFFTHPRRKHNVTDRCLQLVVLLLHQPRYINITSNSKTNKIVNSVYNLINNLYDSDIVEPSEIKNNKGLRLSESLTYQISFNLLYDAISRNIYHEWSLPLLFSLLHGNQSFKTFFCAKTDVDIVLLPLLEQIYNYHYNEKHEKNDLTSSNQTYITLIILLLLTKNKTFTVPLFSHIIIPKVPFLHCESLINLGSVIIVVLLKVMNSIHIQSTSSKQDLVIHEYCLSILFNLSPHAVLLHPFSVHRLINLLNLMIKRYTPNDSILSNAIDSMIKIVLSLLLPRSSVSNIPTYSNTHLINSLLQTRQTFKTYCNTIVSSFEYLKDIIAILDWYQHQIDKSLLGGMNVPNLNSVIESATHKLAKSDIKLLTRSKISLDDTVLGQVYSYEEEKHPENFFLPYIWSIFYTSSGIYWLYPNITLFTVPNEYYCNDDDNEIETKTESPTKSKSLTFSQETPFSHPINTTINSGSSNRYYKDSLPD